MAYLKSDTDVELFESYGRLINPSYPQFLNRLGIDKTAIRAVGATITDSDGKVYIDCVGGYGIFNLGHNHPKIIEALIHQLKSNQLVTKPFITELPVTLAKYLSKLSPGDLECSFVCNSGSEAVDSAMKLARLHSGKAEIIAANNSFHGYTFGALSASGISSFKRSFEPLLPCIVHVPFDDLDALRTAITEDTAAILMEPIQHEAGVTLPRRDYFKEVRNICDDKGVILIFDEIKTGFGKTGYMFTCQHFGVVPDMLVVGKSLGGGVIPIGAVISRRRLWRKFGLSFSMSASSFAGNILVCRAALTTLEILQEDGLVDECRKKGQFLLEELHRFVKKYPEIIKMVNGIGLLIGVETFSTGQALELARAMIRQGVLLVPAFGNSSVLMVEPPLVISFDQIQKILESLDMACRELGNRDGDKL
jgi:putrescine aminotransferase